MCGELEMEGIQVVLPKEYRDEPASMDLVGKWVRVVPCWERVAYIPCIKALGWTGGGMSNFRV